MKYKGCHFEKNEIKKVRACDLKRYITLAKNVLGWSPTTDLRAGLALTVEHFRKVLESH